MPRPRAPPTPSASTDLLATERAVDRDMEGTFALPPPAVHKKPTPPVSPVDRPMTAPSPRHKRTLSGATKSKEDLSSIPKYDLPPPPSRARKIIQMKPKASSNSDTSEPSPQAAASSPPKAASKRKQQPSATSAAGRKIARKTAHSIIERRRRSKMNEEFGVLKDMIPACEGVEMHKLAILQAGIEYVRYLEGCIKQLKGDKEARLEATVAATAAASTEAPTDWQYSRKLSTASTISPGGLPPAFNAIHFSPGSAGHSTVGSVTNPSPHILPLPQVSLDRRVNNTSPANMSEGGAEATATAALMMLTKDRRNTHSIMAESQRGSGGMSVRDLLSS
ncbi:hypothetical protein DV735_g4032, partial [Chaetothyriales sp. CBS 134920]